ncbi:uncharacterized protein LOC113650479 isoform X21 [Tachysurus fulvidraco]|uniref:uncharacterized protein LOC113650479 isoform X21 n=1 Tax=Tachysurus fulvidraco TaxID=1234273 RepID=UPI001FEE46E6|nr:uncharacterized protein LOC113650479 isoform X21 [Tachysurus fulvidraco]
MASSNVSAKEYVRNARENLVGRLQNLPVIVEKLHQQNVFNGNEVSEIEAEPEKYNKTRRILDWVLNKGEKACYKFLRILDRERKLVLPKPDSTSQTPDLHTWISLFSFRDEDEDDYIKGPVSCHQLQNDLKTRTKQILLRRWSQSLRFYGGRLQKNFTFIPLVLDTETENNTPRNKITLKSKKSKKSRSKKMKSYIPKDTQTKSPEDLVNSSEKSILIVGKPGIGKTTVVQQMLHHWAERSDRNLDFMFYFDENTLTNISTTESLENLLLSKYLMSNPQLKENAEEILQYLQEYSDSVTIVFDGIRDFQENTVLLEIKDHDLLPEAKIVVTCRPEVEYEFSDWTTCKVYVKGFSGESIYDFFKMMTVNEPELVDIVINNPALFSLCHVPMYALMVAACISYYTSEEAQKHFTATELYVRIFRHCLQRHGNKTLLYLDGHIKDCRDMVLSLAESAFNATKLKTINLEFDYDERGISGAFLKTVSVVSPACAKTFCAFSHNTMQEFFSALWLLEKSEILDEVLRLCQNEDSEHMKHIIPFLCGIQSQTITDDLKCLFPLNKLKDNIDGFFEKVLNTFFGEQPDDENTDIAFICQCLYELQAPETCCSFLERINYHLVLSDEHLDPYTCCAVSYVIRQSTNTKVHLDLENSAVSLSGLKIILKHSHYLRDFSTTLSQIWTIALKCEELNYLINLLQLCGNEIHIPMSSQTDVLEQAGKVITRYAEQLNLHLHCDKDPQQLTDLLLSTVFSWLPHISSLNFTPTQGESKEKCQQKCMLFTMDLSLQVFLYQGEDFGKGWKTAKKIMAAICKEPGEFLLDLFSHVKQYESKTHRTVLPALLPVYRSLPVWSIKLSETKVSVLLEVLKLQTQKIPVELRDCSDEESEVRSFLQCLPYISHLSFNETGSKHVKKEHEKRWRTFLLDLCLHAALHQPQTIQETVNTVMTYKYERCEFLLDLFSHVKQYESKTHRTVLPALLPVYRSLPVWSINLSETKVSVLLEVLKLQTQKIPVEVIDCSDEESEVRSFLQCLPYISHFSFNEFDSKHGKKEQEKRWRTFLLDLCLHAALHQPQTIQETVEKVITHKYEQSEFLLDLFSHVKQYESKTHSSVLPALLPVYQSLPVWSINLSERKVSVLLEVLKLQTQKIPVEVIDCSDEESEVRSFLQCLPYISHLRFNGFDSKHGKIEQEKRWRTFLLDLCLHAALHQPQTIQETVEKVMTHKYERCEFLLDLFSHVKQYESKTHRTVLPALLPVYQSLPVWSINLSERKVSDLLEVLKLQTQKIPVEVIDCSDEESVVRSFLQCLPYISHFSFNGFDSKHGKKEQEKRWRTFLLDLCLHAALHQPQTIQETVEKVITHKYEQSDFLLDLFSHVKQYESKTHRTVRPALLPVYRSLPVWSINLSERKVSVLLEVLKLQTQKIPVELRDCSGEEREVRSFLHCLPYISHLRFNGTGSKHVKKEHEKRWRTFLLDLCLHAALHQPQTIQETLNTVITYKYEQSDFLLDLFSHVKQYESKTHRTVLPALLPVYRSLPVWSINLSETKVSVLLEVLKLQTQKIPVELRDCSDEEREVRSFLQCLPYISHLSFNETGSKHVKKEHEKRWRTFLLDLCLHAALHQPQTIQESVNTVMTYKYEQSDFLLDLFSHVKQYESKTHRTVLPALLPVYRSLPVWSINLSETKVSVLLEVLKLQTQKKPVELRDCSGEESEVRSFLQCLPYISHLSFNETGSKHVKKEHEKRWRTFLLDLCLHAALHQPQTIQETLNTVMTYKYEQSDFLLDLFSHVKQYESKTHRTVLPALLPVYRSLPVWSINLSETKVSVLLEVLKLQTQKKRVELRNCSDEESEVRSFLQCLPYISHLSFNVSNSVSTSVQFMVNLIIAAVDCQSDKGESFTELLVSVCSYNTFPFRQEVYGFHEKRSDFLLDLFSHVKQYESKTHRTVLPVLLPVYRSLPVWYIDLSERNVSDLLEVLKLQTQKMPVELRNCSDEESEVRSFLQCLPYISELRCDSWLIPRLSKAVVAHAEDTELVRAFFAAMDFVLIIDWVLTTRECRAVRKLLNLSDSKLKLTLKPQAISLRGARLLLRHITHLQKLCLSERLVVRMARAVRAGGSFRSSESRWVIQELCLDFNIINPKTFRYLSSLSSLLNLWTVHCVNLTEYRMEAHSLLSLMCHPGLFKIRLSKWTLQQFTDLLYEAQDEELTRFFLEKVGGDLTSCSLSWEELIYLLQQRVCCISVNIRKNKITHKHTREILPLLSEIQFKRLNPSVLLSFIREIYETDSAHYVSSLLKSTHSCINLNNRDLDSYHCTALCFTLQHCTSVSLSLMWTSIPDGGLVKILPLFNRLSQLSVDRFLLLKLLHCCSISELQQGAAAAVFSALQNRLDFSCSTGLDLSTETQDKTLHLSTEDCRDISTAIQKSQQRTELILEDCELEDTGVDVFLLILHTVRLRCSKSLLLRFLALLRVVNQSDCVMNVMSLSKALNGDMDLSDTPLDLCACKSLALFLEFSEGLSELDLSHCKLTDQGLELLLPHLHKVEVLDLSHNDIDDCLAGRIYTAVSTTSNTQTVRLFNNRITDKEPFQKDKRFEIW